MTLPEARSGVAALAVSDGLMIAGGRDADGKPSTKVWKSTLDKNGVLKPFEDGAALPLAVADASMAQVGDYVWLYGGVDETGPVGAVQRGSVGLEPTPETPAPNATPAPTKVLGWKTDNSYNLPGARTSVAGFAANGALYVVGGDDGNGPRREVYWTVPTGSGGIDAWHHLDQIDLPGGLEGDAPLDGGTNVYLLGGQNQDGVVASGGTANLAPQEPFFQAGLVGVVVPALKIEGEIGQQLGYLNAAGVGTVDFVLLLLIGWAFAHKERVMGWVRSRRERRRGRIEG
jgi:hypothetical protein